MRGVEGTWDITSSSVLGETRFVLMLTDAGGIYLGTSDLGEVRDISVSAEGFVLILHVTSPAPNDFILTAAVDGDDLTGTWKAKYLPEAQLTGRRRNADAVAPLEPRAAAEPEPAASVPPSAAPTGPIAPGLQTWAAAAPPDPSEHVELPPPPPPGIAPPAPPAP